MVGHWTLKWLGVGLCLFPSACNNKEKPELVSGAVNPLTESAAFQDTISEVAWIEGMRRMRVRGYGIVAGLGTRDKGLRKAELLSSRQPPPGEPTHRTLA